MPFFQIAPQRGMLDEVLQVAIGGARGIVHPRGDDDADGDEPVGMRVEKAEDLRLGIAESVPDGAGFEGGLVDSLVGRKRSGSSMRNFMPRAQSRRAWPLGVPRISSMAWPMAPTAPSPTTVRRACTSMPGR